MNKIFSDSLNDLEKILSNQKLEDKTKFYVSFEFTQVDWEDVIAIRVSAV